MIHSKLQFLFFAALLGCGNLTAMELVVAQNFLDLTISDKEQAKLAATLLRHRSKAMQAFFGNLAIKTASNAIQNSEDHLWNYDLGDSLKKLEEEELAAPKVLRLYFMIHDLTIKSSPECTFGKLAPYFNAIYLSDKLWCQSLEGFIAYKKGIANLAKAKDAFLAQIGSDELLKNNGWRLIYNLENLSNNESVNAPLVPFQQNQNRWYLGSKLRKLAVQAAKEKFLPSLRKLREHFNVYLLQCAPLMHQEKLRPFFIQFYRLKEQNGFLIKQLEAFVAQVPELSKLEKEAEKFTVQDFCAAKTEPGIYAAKYQQFMQIAGECNGLIFPFYHLEVEAGKIQSRQELASLIKEYIAIYHLVDYINLFYKQTEVALENSDLKRLSGELAQAIKNLKLLKEAAAIEGNSGKLDKEKVKETTVSVDELKQKIVKLTTEISAIREQLWALVRERTCKNYWDHLSQAAQPILEKLLSPANNAIRLWLSTTDFPRKDHHYKDFSPRFSSDFEKFLGKANAQETIILFPHLIPFLKELYYYYTGTIVPEPGPLPTAQTLEHFTTFLKTVIKDKVRSFNLRQKPRRERENSGQTEGDVEESVETIPTECAVEQVVFASLSKPPVHKQERLSWTEFMKRCEKAAHTFFSVIELIDETEERVVLRNYRGFSSSESTVLTLFKQDKPLVESLMPMIDSDTLTKSNDSLDAAWDKYHAFSHEIDRKYLPLCAQYITKGGELAQKLGLKLGDQKYALVMRATLDTAGPCPEKLGTALSDAPNATAGWFVYIVDKKTNLCTHRFFHADKAL